MITSDPNQHHSVVPLLWVLTLIGCGDDSSVETLPNPCATVAPPIVPGLSYLATGGPVPVQSFGPYLGRMYCQLAVNRGSIDCSGRRPTEQSYPTARVNFRARGHPFPSRIPDGTVFRQGIELDLHFMDFALSNSVYLYPSIAAQAEGRVAQGNVQVRVVSGRYPADLDLAPVVLDVSVTGQACGLALERTTATLSAAFDFRSSTEWTP